MSGNVLIVGAGSIGNRHAEVLQELGRSTYWVSSHLPPANRVFRTIEEALKNQSFQYVIIANSTHLHSEALQTLDRLSFEGKILIEKPLFHKSTNIHKHHHPYVKVGYQFRFHPLIEKLKAVLVNDPPVSVSLYVGQNLSSWRSNRPYQQSYSSQTEFGGGVVRDLSHELDLILWLFGDWNKLVSNVEKCSNLDIQSEDYAACLIKMKSGLNVSVELNYIDHIGKRELIVNGNKHTYKIDLMGGYWWVDQQQEVHQINRNQVFSKMHSCFLSDNQKQLCTFSEGLAVVRMIEAIEKSNDTGCWVTKDRLDEA